MQRLVYCILFFLFVKNSLFSQSVRVSRASQLDSIASLKMIDSGYIVSAYLSDRVYIIQRSKDSLVVTTYVTTVDHEIAAAYALLLNTDTLFTKEVCMLYDDIKQNHSYQSYSKEILIMGGNFSVIFYENNKLQIFCKKDASQSQKAMVQSILGSLNAYMVSPFSRPSRWKRELKIDKWNDLLNYLKTGVVNSLPK